MLLLYYVTTDLVPLKNAPKPDAKIVDRLNIFSKINVLEINGLWATVLYNEKECYISTIYINDYKYMPVKAFQEIIETPLDETQNDEVIDEVIDIIPEENLLEDSFDSLNKNGSILIKCIDIESNDSLSEEILYDELSLGKYIISPINLSSYEVIDNINIEVDLNEDDNEKVITFKYSKLCKKVTINYINIVTDEYISDPDIYTDLENDYYTYEPKVLDGFEALSNSKTIIIDDTVIEVNISFYYK